MAVDDAGKTVKISVIIPSYNQAEFLGQAIESVLQEQHPSIELIVMDGGSTDGSVDVITRHARHLAHWESRKDRGQADAINRGMRASTGEVVAWLNSDDYYLPGALRAVSEAFESAGEDVGFIFGTGIRVDRAGGKIADFWPHEPVFSRAALLYGFDYILQPAVFIRRSALFDVGLLDESLSYALDYDLWLRLSEKYRAVPVRHPVAASREYGETKSLMGGLGRCAEINAVVNRHTGLPATPGSVYYLLVTLKALSEGEETRGLFTRDFARALEILYFENLAPLRAFSDRDPGFPEKDVAEGALERMQEAASRSTGAITRLEGRIKDLEKVVREQQQRLEAIRRLPGYSLALSVGRRLGLIPRGF
jgi:hypothetical protein